ncbi:BT0820 family HAD-type phosphatase [Proteiniphilum sp. UBA5384]|uniref:BT0820 family HAD-type phosphatase n=1 Tax=Proteiniphilum sp. UBA5384 TaxID=1947279 RepID=UPI0025FE3454|nr:hypothetical protein [Proteiniphilum sp. UBA5384]
MIIAIDFDGTIVEHAYPKIGKPIPFAIETLQQIQKDGHKLILWTVRRGQLLQDAVDYCAERGLYFYAENENYRGENKEMKENVARKLNADLYIDDRNLGGLPDWGVIYNAVKATEAGINALPLMAGQLTLQQTKAKKPRWLRAIGIR